MGVTYKATTMKELLAVSKQMRADRAKAHRIKHQHDGFISPFTDKEYKQVKTGMKTSYGAKAKKHSHNGLWKYYDVKIETL
jgi:hypothetical protein